MTDFNRTLSFNVGIAEETSIEAAVLYDELAFLAPRGKRPDGWVYKTYIEMQERLPLSQYKIHKAYGELKAKGLIETKIMKADGSPTMHFKLVKSLIFQNQKTSFYIENQKTSFSINSNSPATHINKENKTNSDEIEKLYTTYLDRFIIPTRLKDLTQYTGPELLALAKNRYKLTPKRRAALKRRLEDAGYKLVGAAIVGFSRESWYLGDNDRGWIADLETYICRSYEIIEKGADLYEAQKKERTGR